MTTEPALPTATLKTVLYVLGILAAAAKICLFASEIATGTDFVAHEFGGILTIGAVVGLLGGLIAHCRDQILAHITRVTYEVQSHGDQLAAELHGYGDQRAAHAAEHAERETMRTFTSALGAQATTVPTQGGGRFSRTNGRPHITTVD